MPSSTHSDDQRGAEPSQSAAPVKVQLVPLFPTWLYVCENGPSHLNERLEDLAHTLMQDPANGARRSNEGGWHYASDVFDLDEPVVSEFGDVMRQHVNGLLRHLSGNRREHFDFVLKGWMNVNRAGDKNILHCHPGCFLSAVYYVTVPPDMRGGELFFRDPRGPAVAMYETPGIDLPWVGAGIGEPFSPRAGQLLIFPSWLEHRVEPFVGAGERISIAFNASNS